METVKWSPFRELDAMERRMRRLFEGTGFAPSFLPAADVYETEDEYVVELEVPGFEEKELAIEVADHTVSVKAERSEEKEEEEEEEDKTYHLHERLERSFERRFQLPAEADTGKVKAEFAKGVLAIHAPKLKAAKPRKVAIGAEK